MVQQSRFSKCLLDVLERLLTGRRPFDRLGFAFEALEEMIEMTCCLGDKPTIVVYHPQKGLQLLDVCRWRDLPDGLDSFGQRRDAIRVDLIAQKLERRLSKQAFRLVYDEPILLKQIEDCLQVSKVFFRR